MVILALLQVFLFGEVTTYRGFQHYQPYTTHTLFLLPEGHFAVWEHGIWIRYGQDGTKLGPIGGKGQGPGEYGATAMGGFDDERIYLPDFNRGMVNFYDLKGQYLADFHHKDLNAALRVSNGWVSLDHHYGRNDEAFLYWFDHNLKEKKTLHAWQQVWMSPDVVHRNGLSRDGLTNPAKEQVEFRVSPDHNTVFLLYSGPRLAISVFDVTPRRQIRKIHRDEIRPVPFNKDWGKAQIRKARKDYPQLPVNLSAPTYFPLVRRFSVLENRLILQLWTADPSLADRYLILDYEGNEARLDFDPRHAYWILGRQNGFVYFSGMDDGQAVIHKIPEVRFSEFADQHPVTWEPKLYFTLDFNTN